MERSSEEVWEGLRFNASLLVLVKRFSYNHALGLILLGRAPFLELLLASLLFLLFVGPFLYVLIFLSFFLKEGSISYLKKEKPWKMGRELTYSTLLNLLSWPLVWKSANYIFSCQRWCRESWQSYQNLGLLEGLLSSSLFNMALGDKPKTFSLLESFGGEVEQMGLPCFNLSCPCKLSLLFPLGSLSPQGYSSSNFQILIWMEGIY